MKSILNQLKKYQPTENTPPIVELKDTEISEDPFWLKRVNAFIKRFQLPPKTAGVIKSLYPTTYTDILYPFELYWAYTLHLDISALTYSTESYCDEVLRNFICTYRHHPQTKNPDYDKLLGEALIGSETASKLFAARVIIATITPGRSDNINSLPPHVAPVMREALGNPSNPYLALESLSRYAPIEDLIIARVSYLFFWDWVNKAQSCPAIIQKLLRIE